MASVAQDQSAAACADIEAASDGAEGIPAQVDIVDEGRGGGYTPTTDMDESSRARVSLIEKTTEESDEARVAGVENEPRSADEEVESSAGSTVVEGEKAAEEMGSASQPSLGETEGDAKTTTDDTRDGDIGVQGTATREAQSSDEMDADPTGNVNQAQSSDEMDANPTAGVNEEQSSDERDAYPTADVIQVPSASADDDNEEEEDDDLDALLSIGRADTSVCCAS